MSPPRRSAAILWDSMRSCMAVPPCMARLERAWPRTTGIPSSSQRSASQVPRAQALEPDRDIRAERSQRLETCLGISADVVVHAHLALGSEDTEGHPIHV